MGQAASESKRESRGAITARSPPKRNYCYTLLDRDIKCRIRAPDEAWHMVRENMHLVPEICRKYGLHRKVRKDMRPDVESLVACSLFNSATSWDGRGSEFAPYAIECAKECIWWVRQLHSMVQVKRGNMGKAMKFFCMRPADSNVLFRDFLIESGVPEGQADSIICAVQAIHINRNIVGAHGHFNSAKDPEPDECGRLGIKDSRRMCMGRAAHSSPVGDEYSDLCSIRGRMEEIFREVLTPREFSVLMMTLGEEGCRHEEIAREAGVSRQMVTKIIGRARMKLATSEHAGELRECLELFEHYSTS
ncbi:hypothetical protein JW721_05485 [Candidatus Micrarchaeota archaeon]|nr:hypothetical protein [Candidatus Micrarchaeota archaeon]